MRLTRIMSDISGSGKSKIVSLSEVDVDSCIEACRINYNAISQLPDKLSTKFKTTTPRFGVTNVWKTFEYKTI